MTICGLWHGAGWGFIIWGSYHGILLLIYRLFPLCSKINKKAPLVSWIINLFFITLGWIFFRCQNIIDAIIMIGKIFNPFQYKLQATAINAMNYFDRLSLFIGLCLTYLLSRSSFIQNGKEKTYFVLRSFMMIIVIILVLTYLKPAKQFIYFQF